MAYIYEMAKQAGTFIGKETIQREILDTFVVSVLIFSQSVNTNIFNVIFETPLFSCPLL